MRRSRPCRPHVIAIPNIAVAAHRLRQLVELLFGPPTHTYLCLAIRPVDVLDSLECLCAL